MKRLHPSTAVFRAVNAGSAGLGIGLLLTGVLLAVVTGDPDVANGLLLVVAAVVGGLIGAGYGVLQYLRFEYDVRDETVSIAHGVLARTERDIPFRRIQNVDIRRGIVARLLGVATVNLETAGGGSTEAVLKVVTVEEAERIQDVVAGYESGSGETGERREVVEDSVTGSGGETVSGATGESADSGPADETADERSAAGPAPQTASETTAAPTPSRGGPQKETLFELSNEDLTVLSVVSFDPAGLALLIFSIPFGQEFAFEILSRTVAAIGGPSLPSMDALTGLSTVQLVVILLVAAVQFVIAAWLASAVVTAIKYYDFRLIRVGEDLRYERGLLQRYTGTIPLEKVQTVTVRENAAMRRAGYAALDLETAGYGPSQGNASNTAIPLDERAVVVSLAERLGGIEYPDVDRPPKRARRRYAVRLALIPLALTVALFALDRTLYSFPRWWIPLVALPLAPIGGHYMWKHRGHALTETAFLARSSFWRRHTRIVPYYRVQTVIDERSVFQRWRHLASVTADTASTSSIVGGNATAYDVDEATAVDLHRTLRDRLAADLGRRRAERGLESAGGEPATLTSEGDAEADEESSDSDTTGSTES